MLINSLRKSPPQRPQRDNPVQPKAPSTDSVDLSSARHSEKSSRLGKLLASVSALALTALPQAAEAAEAVLEQQTQAQLAEIDLVLSSTRAADTRVDPRLGQKWRTPEAVMGLDGGKVYHFPKGTMASVTAKHLTADSIGAGAPKLTAYGVDPNQGTKQYPEGQVSWTLTEPFKECTAKSSEGTCLETRWESISYKNISCTYRNENTGELVRVLHRSTANSDTSRMDRSVCAGHRLVKDSNGFYGPVQTDARGNKLYVNPLNIVEMEVLQK